MTTRHAKALAVAMAHPAVGSIQWMLADQNGESVVEVYELRAVVRRSRFASTNAALDEADRICRALRRKAGKR